MRLAAQKAQVAERDPTEDFALGDGRPETLCVHHPPRSSSSSLERSQHFYTSRLQHRVYFGGTYGLTSIWLNLRSDQSCSYMLLAEEGTHCESFSAPRTSSVKSGILTTLNSS